MRQSTPVPSATERRSTTQTERCSGSVSRPQFLQPLRASSSPPGFLLSSASVDPSPFSHCERKTIPSNVNANVRQSTPVPSAAARLRADGSVRTRPGASVDPSPFSHCEPANISGAAAARPSVSRPQSPQPLRESGRSRGRSSNRCASRPQSLQPLRVRMAGERVALERASVDPSSLSRCEKRAVYELLRQYQRQSTPAPSATASRRPVLPGTRRRCVSRSQLPQPLRVTGSAGSATTCTYASVDPSSLSHCEGGTRNPHKTAELRTVLRAVACRLVA